jgi:hypothetical protein
VKGTDTDRQWQENLIRNFLGYVLCPSDERSPFRNGGESDILFTNRAAI